MLQTIAASKGAAAVFSGIVERMGIVSRLIADPPGVRLVIESEPIARDTKIGDSIAVNGCCLTVVQVDNKSFGFDAGAETLSRTNLGRLRAGSPVNLERSLKVGGELGGHFVSGHIDAVGWLDRRQDEKDWSTFWFRMPGRLSRQMASKGSIAVDGVSLTLVEVEAERFSVALIPHTLQITTLGPLQPGDPVNLETDILAKYVEKQLAGRWEAAP
jgi:riboflavin synthase